MFIVTLCIFYLSSETTPYQSVLQARAGRDNTGLAKIEEPGILLQQQMLLTYGQTGNPACLTELESFLDHASLRATAIFAWGEVDGAPVAPLMARAAKIPAEERLILAEALAKRASGEDAPAIFQLWQAWPPKDQMTALYFLWRLGHGPLNEAVVSLANGSLGADDHGVLFYLARAGVGLSSGTLLRILPLFAQDSQALIYWSRIKPTDANPKLEEAYTKLCKHEDWRLRVQALNALARDQAPDALGQHLAALSDPNPNVVRTAIPFLAKSNQAGIQNLLAQAVPSFSPSQQQTLAVNVDPNQDGPFHDYTILASWQNSDSLWKKRQWTRLMGQSRTPPHRQWLEQQAQPLPDPAALLAAYALSEYENYDMRPLLGRAVASNDPYALSFAADILHQQKDHDAFLLLTPLAAKAYAEPDFHFSFLGNLKDVVGEKDFPTELEKYRRHPDYLVRLRALSLMPDPDLNARIACFEGGWQRTLPDTVMHMADTMGSGNDSWIWILKTDKGLVHIQLSGQWAPITCANIAYLSGTKYFDNMPIHRVVPNFVVQAGDNRGDGSGGPGYAIPCEINPQRFRRGTVGMALAGKDTGGSQWFICHSSQPHLDGGYTVFGQVVKGMEVVDRLEEGDRILSARVLRQ